MASYITVKDIYLFHGAALYYYSDATSDFSLSGMVACLRARVQIPFKSLLRGRELTYEYLVAELSRRSRILCECHADQIDLDFQGTNTFFRHAN